MKYTKYCGSILVIDINDTIQYFINRNIEINNELIIFLIKNQYFDKYQITNFKYKNFIDKCFNIIGEKQLLFDCCNVNISDFLHLLCFLYPILTEELEFKIIKKLKNKKFFHSYAIETILENYDFKYEKNKKFVEGLKMILKLQ